MSWSRKCLDVCRLQPKDGAHEGDQLVLEVSFMFRSEVPTDQGFSTGDSVQAFTLPRNEVGRQVLREFRGYHLKQKVEIDVEDKVMSLARLVSGVATVLRCSVEIKSVEDTTRMSEPRHREE